LALSTYAVVADDFVVHKTIIRFLSHYSKRSFNKMRH
jgi:hypothetical protein